MHCARALLRAFQKEPVSSSHSRCLRDPLASLVRGHSSPSNSAKASDCLLSVFALPKRRWTAAACPLPQSAPSFEPFSHINAASFSSVASIEMSGESGTPGTSTDDAAAVVGSEEKAEPIHRGSPVDDKGGTECRRPQPRSSMMFWRAAYSTSASEGAVGALGTDTVAEVSRKKSKEVVRPRVVPPGGFLALNTLHDNPGSRHQKTRLGRGIGSGKGKTAGRGHKGQKARNGRNPRLGFEGGQTPLRLRIPKRGFTNVFGHSFQEVNLGTIAEFVKQGRIDASQLITMKTLKDAGALGKKVKDGVKLLGRGSEKLSLPLNIEVSRVSGRAKEALEAAGGSVMRVHYNQLGLRALLNPKWFEEKGRLLPQPARPTPKLQSRVDAIGRLPAPVTPLASTEHSSLASLPTSV